MLKLANILSTEDVVSAMRRVEAASLKIGEAIPVVKD
jgi:hypothetical protein